MCKNGTKAALQSSSSRSRSATKLLTFPPVQARLQTGLCVTRSFHIFDTDNNGARGSFSMHACPLFQIIWSDCRTCLLKGKNAGNSNAFRSWKFSCFRRENGRRINKRDKIDGKMYTTHCRRVVNWLRPTINSNFSSRKFLMCNQPGDFERVSLRSCYWFF